MTTRQLIDSEGEADKPVSPLAWAAWSLVALLVSAAVVSTSMRIGGYIRFDPPVRLLGIAAAAVCVTAFLQCPRQARGLKLLTLVLLIPAVAIGVLCLGDVASAMISQNEAVRYFMYCQRMHVC